jgi:hypothetical protein
MQTRSGYSWSSHQVSPSLSPVPLKEPYIGQLTLQEMREILQRQCPRDVVARLVKLEHGIKR